MNFVFFRPYLSFIVLVLPVDNMMDMELQFTEEMLYFAIVIPVGILLLWISKRHINRVEKARKKSILGRWRFESIKTRTPLNRPLKETQDTAIENVESRFSIIKKLSFYTIALIWIIALIFPFLNSIPANFISVLIAAFSVIIGIAARTFIENLISGIVISFAQPFRVGDTVLIDGHYGSVEDITITHSIIKIWNWRRYIVPNSRMLQKDFVNLSLLDTFQWAHIEFHVAYHADLEKVKELAIKAASDSKYSADYEDPKFWVMKMDERSYQCWLAAWANTSSEAWELKNDMRTNLIISFNTHHIDTHVYDVNQETPPDYKGEPQGN